MKPSKRRPATPAGQSPPMPAPKDGADEAPIDTPASQAPVDAPKSQAPIDSPASQAPVDTPESQAPIDLPASQGAKKPALKDRTREAPTVTPSGQASTDTPANQGLPRPPSPAPRDHTQRAPIDTLESQAPIDTPASLAPADEPASQAPIDKVPSQEPTRAESNDATELLGPDGKPITEGAAAGGRVNSVPPTKQARGRGSALHPERVWPD